jgi:hypothetical protein
MIALLVLLPAFLVSLPVLIGYWLERIRERITDLEFGGNDVAVSYLLTPTESFRPEVA